MRRPEEILEIAEIIEDATEKLAQVFERSGADKLHPPDVLREMTRYELELVVVDLAGLTFGTSPDRGWR